MPPVAIIGAGLAIGGVGAVASAKSQSKAATKAADTATQTAAMNNALTRDIYNQNKQTLSPFVQTGTTAMNALNGLYGLGTAEQNAAANDQFGNYIANSDYGFQFGQGTNALNSGYAGAGTLQSGAAMKALEQYRQNLQSGYRTEYASGLSNQQGVGLNAAGALAGVSTNYANTISANNNTASSTIANAALVKGASNPFANLAGTIGGGLISYGSGGFG